MGPALAPPAPTPGASAAPSPAADETPALPTIDDAMLVPVQPAPHVLGSFREALRFVRTRATGLQIASSQVEQSAGQKQQVLAGTMPTLTANGALSHHLLYGTGAALTTNGVATRTIPDPGTILTGSLDFRQPLLAFTTWKSLSAAQSRINAAELTRDNTQRVLLAAVADAAVGVVTATRVAESSRVSLGAALSALELTRKRAALGAASAVDVLRADQEVAQSRAQVVEANETLRRSREALGATLGDTAPWSVSDDLRMEQLERSAAEVCKKVDTLDTRADIQAAAKTTEAAEQDRRTVDYTYVPTLDLTSSLGYVSSTIRSPNGEHVTWTVGGVLSWPLFDGGDRYGQMRARDAATNIARQQLVQTRRDASIEVTQAERAVLVAQANVEVSTKARDIAKESSRLSRIAFVNGTGTSFDLVDSARRLREAEIDLLIKDFDVYKARIAAYLARANCAI